MSGRGIGVACVCVCACVHALCPHVNLLSSLYRSRAEPGRMLQTCQLLRFEHILLVCLVEAYYATMVKAKNALFLKRERAQQLSKVDFDFHHELSMLIFGIHCL